MDRLPAALMYLGLGWAVIPVHTPGVTGCSCGEHDCASPGKHPRVRWHSHMDAPTTVDEVRSWWRRWPDANLGVITGPVSGVVVLDVDPRSGGDETLSALTGEIEPTVETSTGGGGRHLWFATTSNHVTPSRILGPGVELKSVGSTVVVPPSLHVSGQAYVWRSGREPWAMTPAAAPAWIIEVPGVPRPVAVERTERERSEFRSEWAKTGVSLEPGDRYYRCPFHDDAHPSLHIDAEGCRWFCFGCRRGGGVGMLRRLVGGRSTTRRVERITGQVGRPRPVALRGPCDIDVVGESLHQDTLLDLVGGERPYGGVDVTAVAELVFDPEGPHDSETIEVRIDDRPVGHLDRGDAAAYRALIEDSLDMHGFATCWARVRGGWDRGRGDVGALGVILQLPASDDL